LDGILGPDERQGSFSLIHTRHMRRSSPPPPPSSSSSPLQAQLRLAAQRLAQIRDRTDAQGHVISKDIATLLSQRSVTLARAKAQKLIHDEIVGDMLEHLEMLLGVLSERIAELDRFAVLCPLLIHHRSRACSRTPRPPVVEAAASVIYAAPYVDSKGMVLLASTHITNLGVNLQS
jgi:hypothetical protein